MLLPATFWNSVEWVLQRRTGFYAPCASAPRRSCSVSLCGLPLRGWAVVAPRHFHFMITAPTALAGQTFVGKVASYDGAMLKVTELFCKGHSTANVGLWRLHGCGLNFIHLSAAGVAEIAKSTNLNGCPHTFVYIVYAFWWHYIIMRWLLDSVRG